MSDIEQLLAEEGAAAEANQDAPVQSDTVATRGHNRSKTLQVRLNDDEYAALASLADARNLPVSTMVRALLLPAIDPESDTPAALIERMRRELDLLSQRIA